MAKNLSDTGRVQYSQAFFSTDTGAYENRASMSLG